MGADLIFQYFCLDEDTDMEQTKKNMIKAVDDVALEEDFDEISDYYYTAFGDNLEKDEVDINEVKDEFKTTIKELFDGIAQGWRDITYIQHKGDKLWFTGGMSWGDNPTESYNYFMKINQMPEKIIKAGNIHY